MPDLSRSASEIMRGGIRKYIALPVSQQLDVICPPHYSVELQRQSYKKAVWWNGLHAGWEQTKEAMKIDHRRGKIKAGHAADFHIIAIQADIITMA